MKKILFFLVVMLFVYIPLVNAQKDTGTTSQPQSGTLSTPQPIPGTMAAAGMGQEMIPTLRESVDILKEFVKILEGSDLAGQNTDLIQKAKDVIKKGEDAISRFTQVMGSQAPGQVQQITNK